MFISWLNGWMCRNPHEAPVGRAKGTMHLLTVEAPSIQGLFGRQAYVKTSLGAARGV